MNEAPELKAPPEPKDDEPAKEAEPPQELPPAPPPALEPVRGEEREIALDILRAFALFGVLMVNWQLWFRTNPLRYEKQFPYPGIADQIADGARNLLFDGRFLALFSLLFGAGLAIQAERAERATGRPKRFLARRLAVLFLLGAAHVGLLWSGDILHIYAVVGLVLLLVLRRKVKTVGIVGGIFVALPLVIGVGYGAVQVLRGAPRPERKPDDPAETIATLNRFIQGYGQGDLFEVARMRFEEYARYAPLIPVLVLYSFTLATLGVFAWKMGIFTRTSEHRRLLKWTLVLGLVFGLGIRSAEMIVREIYRMEAFGWWSIAVGGLSPVGMTLATLGYGSGILLLLQRDRPRAALTHLAPVGRMALTNYLLHSIIGSIVFYGFGFGLYDKLGPAVGALLVIAVFTAQVIVSPLWLRRFRFGPVEWVWRSLTYWRPQPMRLPRAPSEVTARAP
jgi:uncharacterized protein